MMAALDAKYAPHIAAARKPMIEAVVTIAPPPAAAIALPAYFVVRNVPVKFTAIRPSHSVVGTSINASTGPQTPVSHPAVGRTASRA
jgi:hypothetical protein